MNKLQIYLNYYEFSFFLEKKLNNIFTEGQRSSNALCNQNSIFSFIT